MNFDWATNPHPHPTDFAHEICIRWLQNFGWLRHIPTNYPSWYTVTHLHILLSMVIHALLLICV